MHLMGKKVAISIEKKKQKLREKSITVNAQKFEKLKDE